MSGILRRCATLLCAVVVVGALAGVPAAGADGFSRLDRDPVEGEPLTLTDGREIGTALFSLRVADHDSVQAYSAASDKEVHPRAAYVESVWSDVEQWTETLGETDPPDRASWIVSHSYPTLDLSPLAEETGLPPLREQQAIAGTQAALWHVLEGAEPDRDANDDAVLALYDHLVEGSAAAVDNTVSRSLEITPSQVEATAPEEPLGPLTVHVSGAGPVKASVRGAPASWLVDAEGEQVTQVRDGEEVFLRVDPSVPAGVVTLHVRGQSVPLPQGRLFTGRDGVRTQPLVTAEAGSATSVDTATFTWRPEAVPEEPPSPGPAKDEEPSPEEVVRTDASEAEVSPEADDRIQEEDLANTGTWLSGLLVIAGALVVSGLIILVLGRKRRD
ncbi:thioester domain-containing protein [Nocardiopsis sp. ATB16-24]|uniref:thioester domain-containing protein n=1 Tax=Nocardiopsis sp. ATB16-24 TaxID=3019555 RepID=UPI002555C4F4|nr:thioester domain-containing protein [Nocardiopsis sp. ATB16-24]